MGLRIATLTVALLIAGGLIVAATSSAKPVQVDRTAPQLVGLRALTLSPGKYAGDRRLFVTISPNGDGVREMAKISFTLTERATVRLRIARTLSRPEVIYEKVATFGPGRHVFNWSPDPTTAPRTYLTLLNVSDAAGNRRTYGAANAETGRRPTAPVIRVLGVEAGFTRESYVPGDTATLAVETDASALSLQVFRAGPEDVPTYNDTLMNGVPVTDPVNVGWSGLDGPGTATVPIGNWASGLYFAKLTDENGRIGFAPFVLRPAQLGATRVAVILPTNTWQAYNFRDENGNGWGDTWYAKGSQSTVRLGRAFLRRGVPPQYRKYDLGFLRWLAQRGKQPDYLSETDLEVLNGDTLAKLYDLVIFGGHTEYVTPREFDAVERYRDLGGNLIFLSANNFFWQVQRRGGTLTRTRKWRDIGRPESALRGVQYRGNDDGRIQRPFIVRGTTTAPWLFVGTDLSDGAEFGQELGGYGIEIDATTKASPPGTIVLAEIPELYGPTFTAQMTYYETPIGAKVFAAGAIDFGGTALLPVVSRMLENLWSRLSVP
ncbi:MAG: hypothetical protein LH654_15070 [Thermoleophilia bacterium]|nr:hypothetical protein [Thermoleophilia bacterium]